MSHSLVGVLVSRTYTEETCPSSCLSSDASPGPMGKRWVFKCDPFSTSDACKRLRLPRWAQGTENRKPVTCESAEGCRSLLTNTVWLGCETEAAGQLFW